MHTRTLLALIALVAALGALVWWQLGRERALQPPRERALLEGLERARIESIRVDHLGRSLQLALRPDPEGGWRITDPLRAEADPATVDMLLEQLAARGVPHPVEDLAGVGLAPPRAVVEVRERRGAGEVLHRVELGAPDVDRRTVFARVDGEVLRVPRTLETVLDRDLTGWRQRRLVSLAPETVVELHRSGALRRPDQDPLDLTLDAVVDDGWRATAPFRGALDPSAVAGLLFGLANLQATAFVEDAPADLAHYGLDPPEVRLEVVSAAGERVAVRLARANRPREWYAVREGAPAVQRVDEALLPWILMPAERFLDPEIVRTLRERIERVRLVAGGREVLLERAPRGAWTLRVLRGGVPELGPEPADPRRVADLLGELEQARVLEFLPQAEMPAMLVEQGFTVFAQGSELGGSLGPHQRTAEGGEGVLFQRHGDSVVGLVEPRLLELAQIDPQELRSLVLHEVGELEVVRVELRGAGVERVYVRDDQGRWSPQGSRAEARDFAALVDRLLKVRAQRLVPPGLANDLEEPLRVALVRPTGGQLEFTLGRGALPAPEGVDGGGEAQPAVLYRSEGRAGVVDPQLHADLLALLRPG